MYLITLYIYIYIYILCSYQEKRISLKLSRLCLTINNDRIWLLWNNLEIRYPKLNFNRLLKCNFGYRISSVLIDSLNSGY